MTRFLASVLALMLILASGSAAELRRTSANLPYRFPQVDAFGNVWMLYNGGRLMQQGNMPFCSDSANLTVNGQGIQPQNQSVALENGEAVIDRGARAGTGNHLLPSAAAVPVHPRAQRWNPADLPRAAPRAPYTWPERVSVT